MKTEEYLMHIARQEKQFDALYRSIGALWGLPDCTMWILYYMAWDRSAVLCRTGRMARCAAFCYGSVSYSV